MTVLWTRSGLYRSGDDPCWKGEMALLGLTAGRELSRLSAHGGHSIRSVKVVKNVIDCITPVLANPGPS